MKKYKSPLADPNTPILSYYGPAQGLQDGITIDPEAQGLPIRPYIAYPYRLLITPMVLRKLEKGTEEGLEIDLPRRWHDLLTMYMATASQAEPYAENIYFTIMINGQTVDFKAGIEPMDARPDENGYMQDPTPVIIWSCID